MDFTIRRENHDDGSRLAELRLRALDDAPEAFATTYAEAAQRSAEDWSEQAAARAEGRDRSRAREGRVAQVQLWVADGNEAAYRLYESAGFGALPAEQVAQGLRPSDRRMARRC